MGNINLPKSTGTNFSSNSNNKVNTNYKINNKVISYNNISFSNYTTPYNAGSNTSFNVNSYLEHDTKKTSKYSKTDYSDSDNVNINQMSKLMTDLKNTLTPKEYEAYCEAIEGKTISEILKDTKSRDNNDYKKYRFAEIEGLSKEINDKIKNNTNIISGLSDDMLDSSILEVKNDSSTGYDAMVLKNTAGNYMIINSCTNPSEVEDICAIGYAMCMQLVGNTDFLDITINQILGESFFDELNDIKSKLPENVNLANYMKKSYDKQIAANETLIQKYINAAKSSSSKIELQGYSLGGGIQLTAYANMVNKDPDIEKYINSVTTYNPFISIVQENENNTNKELTNILKKSDKLVIYSAEEDYVSTFNDSVADLKDKMVFLEVTDVEKGTVTSIKDLGDLIIGGKGNHGFSCINDNTFNNGNIQKEGEYVPISTSLSTAINSENLHNNLISQMIENNPDIKYSVNYALIIENTLGLSGIEEKIKGNNKAKKIYKEIKRYIEDKVGNYTYEGLTQSITNGLWDIVLDSIEDNVDGIPIIGGSIISEVISSGAKFMADEDSFKKSMKKVVNSKEGKECIYSIIYDKVNLDPKDYEENVEKLTKMIDENYFQEIYNSTSTPEFLYAEYNDNLRKEVIKNIKSALKDMY